ncbi:MAG: hypothetical protein O2964_02970 [Verrucomicrobia bacterium]|jgi:hypothetical protein|nr:hypothetical protein [Verrucomicrobiota bacterium]
MQHVVNFGLLFCFITLACSGVLSFFQPFSLITTRIHIVFGFLTVLLVGCHLFSRLRYFKRSFRKSEKSFFGYGKLTALTIVWSGLLWVAWKGMNPVSLLIDQGYEARHRAAIVRSSPWGGHGDLGEGVKVIARKPAEDADVMVSLKVQLSESDGPPASVAVWAETSSGSMIETLYIDPLLAYEETPDWGGEPTPRHQILPIWRHRYTLVSGVNPLGEVDAVTGATSSHKFTLDEYLVLGEDKSFVLCVEVNRPGDPNEHYEDKHLGQPSVLYTAFIAPDQKQKYVLLELTGHGGGAEQGGAIQYDLETCTTALECVELLLANVKYEDGE